MRELKKIYFKLFGLILLYHYLWTSVELNQFLGPSGILPNGFGFIGLVLISCLGIISSLLITSHSFKKIPLIINFLVLLILHKFGNGFYSLPPDEILLELSFLSLFFKTDDQIAKKWSLENKKAFFLMRLLLFKVMITSGLGKLYVKEWTSLEALRLNFINHYSPTFLFKFLYELPPLGLETICLLVIVIEILTPLFYFMNQNRVRFFCLAMNLGLMFLITSIGNYGLINLTFALLSISLLRDEDFSKVEEKITTSEKRDILYKVLLSAFVLISVSKFGVYSLRMLKGESKMGALVNLTRMIEEKIPIVANYTLFHEIPIRQGRILIKDTTKGESISLPGEPDNQSMVSNYMFFRLPRLQVYRWFYEAGVEEDHRCLLKGLENYLEKTKMKKVSITYLDHKGNHLALNCF